MEETAGILTPVIEVFRSGDEAAVALKTGLLKLIDDTKPVQEALDSIGVAQRDANGNLRSGKDILLDVSTAFQGLNQDQKLFVTQQLVGIEQSARMVTVFDGLAKSSAITATALNSTGSAGVEVAARLQSSEVAIDRFTNSFKNAAIAVGDQFKAATNEAINGVTEIWQSIGESVNEGDFDEFFDALNGFGLDMAEAFSDIAEAIPEAMDDIDLSNMLDAFGDFKDVIAGLFDGIDLSKPEDLARAFQGVIDTIESIARVSTGIGGTFSEIGEYVSGLIGWFNGLDGDTKEFLGTISGLGAAVSAIAVPVGVAATAITSLTGALTAAAVAGSAWLGLKIADAINDDFYGVDSVLVELEKSAKNLQGEINKLEGTNSTLYKFFKGQDKDVVLDELKAKLQTVKDKILIVKAEANGGDIFKGAEEEAKALQSALEHTAPRFEEVGDKAKELKETIENNVSKVTVDTKEAKEKFEELEVLVGDPNDGPRRLVTIQVPVDTSQVDEAKKKIEEVPAVKRLEFETDLNIERIRAQAETVQTALEWNAKLNIANVEAQTERIKALAGNISEIFKDTGNVITSLFDSWDEGTSLSEKWALQSALKEEQKRRNKALKMQQKLTEAEIKLINAKAERIKKGEATLKIEGADISPHIEAFMWEILSQIQIRASQEVVDSLLLGA